MGAGLSGLACAITLEKHGRKPVIYEKRTQVGDRFVNCEIILSILDRPINDSIEYLTREHGIYLKPTANIKKLIIHSENEKATIKGQLGFTNMRGRDSNSFEKQLAEQVETKINFHSNHTYEELLHKFSHVILATGDADYTRKIQEYKRTFTVTLKGAIISGEFDRYTTRAWLNNKLSPKGYGYLIPISEKKANIVIGYPDYPENQKKDPTKLWQGFYRQVSNDLEQNIDIIDEFEVTGYRLGICDNPRIGNTFFVGNCFGSMMPFLGFGQVASILSGIYAAHDILGLGDYRKLTKPLRESFENSFILRKSLEKLDNTRQDLLVKTLDTKFGDIIFNTEKIDLLKIVSILLRPVVG